MVAHQLLDPVQIEVLILELLLLLATFEADIVVVARPIFGEDLRRRSFEVSRVRDRQVEGPAEPVVVATRLFLPRLAAALFDLRETSPPYRGVRSTP